MRLRQIIWMVLGVRAFLQVFGMVSLAVHGQPVWDQALGMWSRWDAPHYLRIAEVGYLPGLPPPDDPLFIVFFPAFPLAVWLVGLLFQSLIVSGILVSAAASVGAIWFLHRLVALDHSDAVAGRAVALLLAFPTAYFLAAPYTEAMFLFAVLACVYAVRTGAWPRVGVAGALATGTRMAGAALAPLLVMEAWRGARSDRPRRLVWAASAGAGLAAYLLINQLVHGDAFWFLEVQRFHWFQQAVTPWTPVADAVRALWGGVDGDRAFIFQGRLAAALFAVVVLALASRRLHRTHIAYGWAALILVMSTSWLISLPRYLLGVYPLFIALAVWTHRPMVFRTVMTLSVVGQGYLFWRYAAGAWTF